MSRNNVIIYIITLPNKSLFDVAVVYLYVKNFIIYTKLVNEMLSFMFHL